MDNTPKEPQLQTISAPVPLKDQAYAAIKRAILSMELMPGELLVEGALAKKLGISKTPVRTALHELQREGLVTRIAYQGVHVSELSMEDVEEVFELRSVLESLAARQAAIAFTQEDLASARELVRVTNEALRAGDKEKASQYGKRFHDLILMRAHNKRLRQLINNLEDHLQRARLSWDEISASMETSLEEQRQVLQAFEARDPDLAEARVREHVNGVLKALRAGDLSSDIPWSDASQ